MTESNDAVLTQILARLEQLTILQAKVRGRPHSAVCIVCIQISSNVLSEWPRRWMHLRLASTVRLRTEYRPLPLAPGAFQYRIHFQCLPERLNPRFASLLQPLHRPLHPLLGHLRR
jgi:hypothetical protein